MFFSGMFYVCYSRMGHGPCELHSIFGMNRGFPGTRALHSGAIGSSDPKNGSCSHKEKAFKYNGFLDWLVPWHDGKGQWARLEASGVPALLLNFIFAFKWIAFLAGDGAKVSQRSWPRKWSSILKDGEQATSIPNFKLATAGPLAHTHTGGLVWRWVEA